MSSEELKALFPVTVIVKQEDTTGNRHSLTECPGARTLHRYIQFKGFINDIGWGNTFGHVYIDGERIVIESFSNNGLPIGMMDVEPGTAVTLKIKEE